MPDTGIDWDHYDNGPGSEAHKRRMAQQKEEYYQEQDRKKTTWMLRHNLLQAIVDVVVNDYKNNDYPPCPICNQHDGDHESNCIFEEYLKSENVELPISFMGLGVKC